MRLFYSSEGNAVAAKPATRGALGPACAKATLDMGHKFPLLFFTFFSLAFLLFSPFLSKNAFVTRSTLISFLTLCPSEEQRFLFGFSFWQRTATERKDARRMGEKVTESVPQGNGGKKESQAN